jgi:hypothetical protein
MSGPTAEGKGFRLTGQPGAGFFRLVANVDLSVNPGGGKRRVVVVVLGGDLAVRGAGSNGQAVAHLTPMGNSPILDMYGNPETRSVAFCADLDAARLKAIEDIRSNGDLTFTARVFGTLVYEAEVPPGNKIVCTHGINNNEMPEMVNQSDWAKLRRDMGAGRTMLVEVPEPDAERFPELAQAVTYWQEAWAARFRRQRREAVGACRPALEALEDALRAQGGWSRQPELDAILRAIRDNSQALTKEARLQLVHRALMVLCNAALHTDPVCAAMTWEPSDAEFAVTATAAFLGRYIERTP